MTVAIIDTGCANLASVTFAFERLGAEHITTKDPDDIAKASHVIFPGVGAAPFAMEQLRAKSLVPVLRNLEQPVLGICLGMQLMFTHSREGDTRGLGLIDGTIEELDCDGLPAPHMGWNTLGDLADHPLLAGIEANDYTYFVHSYAAPVSGYTLATTRYGSPFSAIVGCNNFYGCQFHPERSGRTGARILENFLGLST